MFIKMVLMVLETCYEYSLYWPLLRMSQTLKNQDHQGCCQGGEMKPAVKTDERFLKFKHVSCLLRRHFQKDWAIVSG